MEESTMPIRSYYRHSGLWKQADADSLFSRFGIREPIIDEVEPHYVTPEEDKEIQELDETLMQMDAYMTVHCRSREELIVGINDNG
jgi:hypothetical protein